MPRDRKAHAKAEAARYKARRTARLCTGCGADLKPLLDWARTVCPDCAKRLADADAKYKATEKARQAQSRVRAARYVARKAAGLCVESGCKSAAAPGRARCLPCIEQHRVWNNEYLDRREEAAHAG